MSANRTTWPTLMSTDGIASGTLTIRCQRHRVIGIHDGPQVGQDVLDLAPVVVLEPADDLIRDSELHEEFLDDAALGVGAVEDGDVADSDVPALLEIGNLLGDEGSLVVLILRLEGEPLALPCRDRSTAASACVTCCWR